MKKSSLIAFLFIVAVIYYVTGGGILLGFLGGSGSSPGGSAYGEANIELTGDQQQNPFIDAESSQQ